MAAYVAGFLVVSKNWDLLRRKHFTFGIGAQFIYVAAQTGIFSFCVNYTIGNNPAVTPEKAAHRLGLIGFGLFMFGRLCGSVVISQFKPHLVLSTYAVINVVLTAICMKGGTPGLYAMSGTFFFMSVMFPDDFCAGHSRAGRAYQVRLVADRHVHCWRGDCRAVHGQDRRCPFDAKRLHRAAGVFRFIAIYGAVWQKIENRNRPR